jgi:hypothetical protein
MSEKSCRVSNACEFVLKNHITCVIKSHTVLLAEYKETTKLLIIFLWKGAQCEGSIFY